MLPWPRCWRSFSTWRAGSQPYTMPQLKCECVNKIVKLQFEVAILFFSLRFLSDFWNGQLHWQKLFTRTLRSAAFGGVQTCRLRPRTRPATGCHSIMWAWSTQWTAVFSTQQSFAAVFIEFSRAARKRERELHA